MTGSEFTTVIENRINRIKAVLVEKGREYQNGDKDVFHNFKVAARMKNITPEQALDGMLLKHLVSLQDIIDNTANDKAPTMEILDAKIGDVINYYLLLEGLLTERIDNNKPF
jgi:hypothetical protein